LESHVESTDVIHKGPYSYNGTDALESFRQLDVRKVCEIIPREMWCEFSLMNNRGGQTLSKAQKKKKGKIVPLLN
jgi:hypothetical protein